MWFFGVLFIECVTKRGGVGDTLGRWLMSWCKLTWSSKNCPAKYVLWFNMQFIKCDIKGQLKRVIMWKDLTSANQMSKQKSSGEFQGIFSLIHSQINCNKTKIYKLIIHREIFTTNNKNRLMRFLMGLVSCLCILLYQQQHFKI